MTLKSGRTVILRPLQSGDEAELALFFSEPPREYTEFLRDAVHDPQALGRVVREHESDCVWAVPAFLEEGCVVGDATLHFSREGC